MNCKNNQKTIILVAEDDEDDRLLLSEALLENDYIDHLYFVEDGVELMDYLYHRGEYSDAELSPRPSLIFLDLNMPRKDGRIALQEIKADPNLRQIPVIILTTSKAEEDIFKTYDLGVNSFITKPVTFQSFVEVMRSLKHYWFEVVELPNKYQKG
jgi:two-component system, response regulator